jgi:uncharacterized protein (TIGR03000 family)
MSSRWCVRFAALTAAALWSAPGTAMAESPQIAVSDTVMSDPYGPNSYIYSPGYAGPGGILNYPGYYGPGYVGSLWYFPNPHWPSRSWYMTYNAGPGGYRVFYPRGNGDSYYYSHRTGIQDWVKVEPVPPEDRSDWQFPRDGTRTRHARLPGEEMTQAEPGRLQDPRTALIEVRVPVAGAEVWIENKSSNQKGTVQRFLSPSLASGKDYVYTIRARWMEGGQPIERERRVTARAGATVVVDLAGAK